jgi:branched-subunit amino acid ABC-type transport system permease component
MSNGDIHTGLGSFITGTAGAWFVALGELDVDPAWSFAKKMLAVVVGGLLAGVTHYIGSKLASMVADGAISRLKRVLRRPSPSSPALPETPPPTSAPQEKSREP